ncbi:MAG: hypothetical protein AABM29_04605 [Actinomycetota bacterium]
MSQEGLEAPRQEWERRADLLTAVAVAGIALLAAFFVMRLWRMDFDVPFVYSSDGTQFLALFKGVDEHGWYLTNPDLGAPFGQENYDFPVTSDDTIHVLLAKALLLLSGDFVTAMHLFFLLGFVLTGLSAFAVLRVLEVSRGPAVVCSALFTLLPYHFVVGELQPFHSSYWVIPLACYLVLAILQDRPLVTRAERPRNRALAFASRRTLLTLALCVVIGSAGVNYYALFAAMLTGAATLLVVLRTRRTRSLVVGGFVTVLLVVMVALNALPVIAYQAEHGSNPTVPQRTAGESETYSLSTAALLLPISDHRVAPLANLRERYIEDSPLPFVSRVTGLGAVGAAGFLWLLGVALVAVAGARPRLERWSTHRHAAAATLVSLLIATTGGFSILFAHLVGPELRTWLRFYPFIAFFALLAIALLLQLAVRRLESSRRRYLATALLGAVLVVGVLDQTSNRDPFVPPYSATAAEFESDGEIVAEIERRLPPGASVFQLPYAPYPEAQRSARTADFDGLRPYLHSSQLRWSYGAMFDRPEDWQAALMDKPFGLVLPSISAAGFQGVLVDRFGYPDDGSRLERALAGKLGSEPLVSPDRRYSFFDMRPYSKRLSTALSGSELGGLRQATLYPLRAEPGDGLVGYMPNGSGATGVFQLAGPAAALELVNPSDRDRSAQLSLQLSGKATLSVELPDGSSRSLRAGRVVQDPISLPPGASAVNFVITAPGPPDQPIYLAAELRDSALDPLSADRPPRPVPPPATLFGGGPPPELAGPAGAGAPGL